ncbi:hypothetical protein HPB47_007707 [Ixodes persulcatus]|uniref:Uncharacterized protein n=1 Tax=Ixodes persulcatus TaxID=34615 RepID=A0AC60P6P6_IXOPE|nr:hypothetical protein HPB47_007707 [Ixodes persulcatus]
MERPRAKVVWQPEILNSPTPVIKDKEHRRPYKPPCEERSRAWLTRYVPQLSPRMTQDHRQTLAALKKSATMSDGSAGTTDTEGMQAASPGLSAAAQVRAVHVMRDAACSAAYERHVAAAADHQVDDNGQPSCFKDRPALVPSVFNYARAPGEFAVQSQDPFMERHKDTCEME